MHSSPPGKAQKRSAGHFFNICLSTPGPHLAPALFNTWIVTSGCLVICSGMANLLKSKVGSRKCFVSGVWRLASGVWLRAYNQPRPPAAPHEEENAMKDA